MKSLALLKATLLAALCWALPGLAQDLPPLQFSSDVGVGNASGNFVALTDPSLFKYVNFNAGLNGGSSFAQYGSDAGANFQRLGTLLEHNTGADGLWSASSSMIFTLYLELDHRSGRNALLAVNTHYNFGAGGATYNGPSQEYGQIMVDATPLDGYGYNLFGPIRPTIKFCQNLQPGDTCVNQNGTSNMFVQLVGTAPLYSMTLSISTGSYVSAAAVLQSYSALYTSFEILALDPVTGERLDVKTSAGWSNQLATDAQLVPEPTVAATLAVGLVLMAARRRTQRRQCA